jgi:hypothetical protein
MKTTSLFTSVCTAALLVTAACKKTKNDEQPADTGRDMMTAFFKQHAPAFESFTVNATAGGSFISSKGTKYFIAPNSLVDASGNLVTGNVAVSVKEIGKASEMILGDKPAVTTGGKRLISFGEFFIKAQQGNNELKLRNDSAVRVNVPVRNPGGAQILREMPLWSGDSAVNITTQGYNDDNQQVSINSTISMARGMSWAQVASQWALYNNSNNGYDFRVDSLIKWRNCDVLNNPGGVKTTVMGYLGDKFNTNTGRNYTGQEPSILFFKVRNQNTIAKLYDVILQPTTGKEGLHSYQQSFTVGEQGTFLAISAKDGKFYAEMRDVTIAAPASGKNYTPYSFNLVEVSQTAMLALIQQMDTK